MERLIAVRLTLPALAPLVWRSSSPSVIDGPLLKILRGGNDHPRGARVVLCHPPRPLRAGRGGVEGAGWAAELERQARIIVTMLADFETVPH